MTTVDTLLQTLKNCPSEGVLLSPEQCEALINALTPIRHEFFVVMQKRKNGVIAPDLSKTDERMYLIEEDAQKALEADPELKPYRQVVRMLAQVASEEEQI